jgi:arylsulfatase A-like enzyme
LLTIDRNVPLIVANPGYSPRTFTGTPRDPPLAPTVLEALGYDPNALQGVQMEGTEGLPGLPFTKAKR